MSSADLNVARRYLPEAVSHHDTIHEGTDAKIAQTVLLGGVVISHSIRVDYDM